MDSIKTGFVKINGTSVFGGEIVGIGGEYSKRYAIVIWLLFVYYLFFVLINKVIYRIMSNTVELNMGFLQYEN